MQLFLLFLFDGKEKNPFCNYSDFSDNQTPIRILLLVTNRNLFPWQEWLSAFWYDNHQLLLVSIPPSLPLKLIIAFFIIHFLFLNALFDSSSIVIGKKKYK